jgi:hypothetical protein
MELSWAGWDHWVQALLEELHVMLPRALQFRLLVVCQFPPMAHEWSAFPTPPTGLAEVVAVSQLGQEF